MKKLLIAALATFISSPTLAEDTKNNEYIIIFQDKKVSPEELVIPAGQKVSITVKNLEASAAEFESHKLKREKVIAANSEAVISVGPLEAGSYKFENEFNKAKGIITVK